MPWRLTVSLPISFRPLSVTTPPRVMGLAREDRRKARPTRIDPLISEEFVAVVVAVVLVMARQVTRLREPPANRPRGATPSSPRELARMLLW